MNLFKINGRLLELLLLNALKENKAYGYEMTNRFALVYSPCSGILFLVCGELSAGKIRVYYTIDKKGEVYRDNLHGKLEQELKDLYTFLNK